MLFSERLTSQLCKCVIFGLLILGFSVVKADIDQPRNCQELYDHGYTLNGVYTIYPLLNSCQCSQIPVYCDMTTDPGGWTVFQRREDGTEDFYRGWLKYEMGFGSVAGEHWLGLTYIHALTATTPHELRVDMGDFEGNTKFAKYNQFYVADDTTGYRLAVSGYSGNAGGCIVSRNGMQFTTFDRDQDTAGSVNCALKYHGAWWYSACHCTNPNGNYHGGNHTSYADGVNWKKFKGYHYSLKFIEFKIRPL